MHKIKSTIFVFLIYLSFSCSFAESFQEKIVAAALERTTKSVTYDGSYIAISYPNGDVPENIGVCTDVIIRTYRKLGIDLQKLVHEDISENFAKYPSKKIWGHNKPDKNIDHRRVPNLEIFLSRNGATLEITTDPKDYQAGDLVTWRLPGNLPHIGIVTDIISADGNPMIVHNIGYGPELEDMLFAFDINGHYRYEIIDNNDTESN